MPPRPSRLLPGRWVGAAEIWATDGIRVSRWVKMTYCRVASGTTGVPAEITLVMTPVAARRSAKAATASAESVTSVAGTLSLSALARLSCSILARAASSASGELTHRAVRPARATSSNAKRCSRMYWSRFRSPVPPSRCRLATRRRFQTAVTSLSGTGRWPSSTRREPPDPADALAPG